LSFRKATNSPTLIFTALGAQLELTMKIDVSRPTSRIFSAVAAGIAVMLLSGLASGAPDVS
jgi:hypothetical protein